MGISIKSALRMALNIAELIEPRIADIERLSRALPTLKGKEKQDAVIKLAKAAVEEYNDYAAKAHLNVPAVEAATRAVIDAIVNLQNVIAKEGADAEPTTTPAAELGSF